MSSAVYGQAAPAAVAANSADSSSLSPSLGGPFSDGMFHYSVSAGEIIQKQAFAGSGTYASTSLSGSVDYTSNSVRFPFSALYAGGVMFSAGANVPTAQTYQNAVVSQQLVTRNWIFGLSDAVSYMPQSPTTGYTGIAGAGDLGPITGPAQGPAGGILTEYGKRVSNGITGTAERKLTASTSINGSSSWQILRFLDATGQDTTEVQVNANLNHRMSARTTVSAGGAYSNFSYGSNLALYNQLGLNGLTYDTRSVDVSVQRLMTHNLSVSVSAGPQWISSSNAALSPATTTVMASASLSYNRHMTTMGLSYYRGANAGSGVQTGTIQDNISGTVSHSFGRDWQAAATVGYTNSSGLITDPTVYQDLGISSGYGSVFGGLQVSRRLSTLLSAYGSYMAISQTSSGISTAPNVFSGTGNIFSVGLTWSPKGLIPGHLF
ncbi:MAG: hypothetical protein FWD64_06160 [Acidobacteriaceae bacterium]|nr:hypothetical protein [Acidobacteriaceae bacterium]